jgi:sec-independent protein translocase protein TatB
MFDVTSSKLLILGLVALIVVGPRELPGLLRTIGKYVAMIRRQATEFRSQFDEAMRESELDQLRKEVQGVGEDLKKTVSEAETSLQQEVHSANAEVDAALAEVKQEAAAPLLQHDPLNGLEAGQPQPAPPLVEPAVAAPAPAPAPLAQPEPAKVGA